MVVRKKDYWGRYPTSTLLKDLEGFERKNSIFGKSPSNLKLSLTTGVRNKSEYAVIKKILESRKNPRGYYEPY